MAKRKRSKGKRRGGKRKSKRAGHRKSKSGLATDVGAIGTLYKLATTSGTNPGPDQILLKWKDIPLSQRLKPAAKQAFENAQKLEPWIPVIGGAAVTHFKHKPIVKIVLGPLDKLSRRYLGMGL